MYVLERVLFRLSQSEYRDRFILKGGVLLYGRFAPDFPRTTSDIDFLARGVSSDGKNIEEIFKAILTTPVDDPLSFDLEGLSSESIALMEDYHGVRLSTNAYLERTRIKLVIDIGFGDAIHPERVVMDYPTIIENPSPSLFAYSMYSVIAEKFEAIVSLGEINSRYKDFFDIALIATKDDLKGETLAESLAETFHRRGTKTDCQSVFSDAFVKNPARLRNWDAFQRGKRVVQRVSFDQTMSILKALLLPVMQAVDEGKPFSLVWNHESKRWE